MQQKLLDRRYGISGLLGSGGMAKVYLAHDDVLGRDVALKVLRDQYSENDEFVERFRREAQAAASLSHPNIVATYDRGCSEDGSYYIVMEYVSGGTLKDRIAREGPLAPDRAAALVSQVAGALGAAHERGVIHRDVKPHNVLLTASGDAKVTDFGIARAASEASLSGTSVILGTVSYMSPEQAMGGTVGPRSDLYSLGVVLHEMLTGEVPFRAETPMAVSMKHLNEPAPSLRETNPEVPEGLNAVRSKLLAKDPEDRYASAGEVVEDLRRVRRGEKPLFANSTPDAPTSALPILPEPRAAVRRRWRPYLVRATVALVGVVGVVGGLGWGLNVSEGRQPEGVISEARQIVARQAEVSRVIGLDRARAQQVLIGDGFEVGVRLRESSEAEAGKVLAQSIPGGERVEKGTKVVLDVGDGPATVPAPDLAGLTLAAAEDVVAEAGLVVGEKTEKPSETVPEGAVIEQSPPAGEKTGAGTPVDLVVSSGPADPPPAAPQPDAPPAAPAASAAPAAPTAATAPAPDPVAEPAASAPTDQYEPAPRQYEPPSPVVASPAPAAPAPAAPAEQYEAPPAQPPAEDPNTGLADQIMQGAGVGQGPAGPATPALRSAGILQEPEDQGGGVQEPEDQGGGVQEGAED